MLHFRTRLLPQVKYCNNQQWPQDTGKSIVAAAGQQRRAAAAAATSGSNKRQLDVLKTAQRMAVCMAHMATPDRTALASLPQEFDAALLAKFYRRMYAAHHA